MGLVIDTQTLDAADRAESLRESLMELSGASQVEVDQHHGPATGRLHLSDLGDAALFSANTSGVRLIRDAREARQGLNEVVAIAVHGRGVGRRVTQDGQRLVRRGDLVMVDLTRPFDFAWEGQGSSAALQVPRHLLGLSVDSLQRVSSRLQDSPLHPLVARHIADLARTSTHWERSGSAAELGTASVQLVRALLAEVADDGRLHASATEETLAAQVREYVRQHVRDSRLGADHIAAALAVSRRHLFRSCARAELSIEQYIIDLRLTGARTDLLDPRLAGRSVAAIAHHWGFRSADHFHRRFREAYGVTPGEWRAASRER